MDLYAQDLLPLRPKPNLVDIMERNSTPGQTPRVTVVTHTKS